MQRRRGKDLEKRKGMIKVNKTKENRTAVYVLRRYLLLCAGLAIMAFGVAFSIKAGLGTSPISSVPYVVSMFAPLTVGTATIVMHCIFILLQILILRRQYHPVQLMQLPVAVFFGYMKVVFDVTLVVTACILSLVFTGRLQGVREGTVAAALMVGLIAKQFGKVMARWELEKYA